LMKTGWRIDGKNYWLWTFTNGEITIYPISKKRNKKIPEKILGKKGIEFNYFRSRLRRIIDNAIKFGEKDVSERIIAKCKFEKKIRDLYSRKWKDKDCIRFSKLLRNHEKELFTFLINPKIKADNNEAERALRPNVILRKITGGNRSKEGADAHSIITSIYQTCNRQNQDFIQWSKDYLQSLITSKL
jgi:transposase